MEIAEYLRRASLQSAEFAAAHEFAKQLKRVCLTAVVDDDYPAVREEYEHSLSHFIHALKENERFEHPSRYGLAVHESQS